MKRTALIFVTSLLAAGCSSTSSGDAAGTAGAPSTPGVCATDGSADSYAPGMTKQGAKSLVTLTLVAATPAPPNKDRNDWQIALTDASGAPLDGATIAVKLWMPVHAHGGNVVPTVTANGGGSYSIDDIVLTMPGLWEITLTIQTASGTDTVKFDFCAAG